MKLCGAIFDLDGTLLDSMGIWEEIGNKFLLSLGIKPNNRYNEVFKTMTLYQSACYCIEKLGLDVTPRTLVDRINSLIENEYLHNIKCKEGVSDFLAVLSEHGVKMCVATATDKHLALPALKRNGIDKYFGEIFTCTDVGKGKNEPDIYNAALSYLGTKIDETLVFEDSYHAAETAKKAGFKVAAVYDKFSGDAAEKISDCIIKSFKSADVLKNIEFIK